MDGNRHLVPTQVMNAEDDHPLADVVKNDLFYSKPTDSETKPIIGPSSRKQVCFLVVKKLMNSVYSPLESGRMKIHNRSTSYGHPISKTVKQYVCIDSMIISLHREFVSRFPFSCHSQPQVLHSVVIYLLIIRKRYD